MNAELTTVAFETVNFIVLLLLLWRLLYRPLRRSIEGRRAAIAEDLSRAREARVQAEASEEEWRQRQTELTKLRAEVRMTALDEAERERSRILARAREDADAERARVTQLLEAEREAAARWVRATVWSRGTELAGRLVLGLSPEGVLDTTLFERLLEVVERHGDELAGQEPAVELTGAHMAERAQVEALREVVTRAVGAPAQMTSREDPSLLAGWRIRIGDRVFDGSLAGELDAFRDLARELADEAA